MGALPEPCWMQEARRKDPAIASLRLVHQRMWKKRRTNLQTSLSNVGGAPNFELAAFRRSPAVELFFCEIRRTATIVESYQAEFISELRRLKLEPFLSDGPKHKWDAPGHSWVREIIGILLSGKLHGLFSIFRSNVIKRRCCISREIFPSVFCPAIFCNQCADVEKCSLSRILGIGTHLSTCTWRQGRGIGCCFKQKYNGENRANRAKELSLISAVSCENLNLVSTYGTDKEKSFKKEITQSELRIKKERLMQFRRSKIR